MTINPNKIYSIIAAFQESYGFDPQGVYCQITGKKIGDFTNSEFDELVESLGSLDPEEMVDDIAMRVLASMRPSIRWNVMREESLKQMRRTAPIETLSYLVNRMFTPRNWRTMGTAQLLSTYSDRIKGYMLLEKWGISDATNTLLYMLLELDAKWNLETESPPFDAWDFFFSAPTMEHRVEMVQEWYHRRIAAWEKKCKADALQVRWTRDGNVLAKPAFMAEYLAARPLSKTAEKRVEKEQEKKFMAGLLSEILMGRVDNKEEAEAVQPKPAFVPIRKMPMQFGVK